MPVSGSNKRMDTSSQADSSSPPVDSVIKMREQGLSSNQIIASLQREGYNTTQIFDAMNQADLNMEVGSPDNSSEGDQENSTPYSEPYQQPDQAYTEQYSPEYGVYQESEVERIEELVEAVVEEKWVDLVKDVSKIIEWKSKVESDIIAIQQKIEGLKGSINQLQKGILGKVDEYDKNISKVNTNIKAMETVFQKVIPTFTENINELSRTVDSLKHVSRKDFGKSIISEADKDIKSNQR